MPALFLDRDGVLNVRTPGDYVKSPDAFIPTEHMGEAMSSLRRHFDRIFVVTNQAGIGKGLMTHEDLNSVHATMIHIAALYGGRFDRIYHCPHRSDAGCPCRKPATGMAWQALADFPDIDFETAWMVGDSLSDMQMADALGMRKVLIEGKTEETFDLSQFQVDFKFSSLWAFARWMG